LIQLSFGIRLAIVLPTVFFLLSQLLRYALKASTKRIISQDRIQSIAGPISLGMIPRFLGERSTREFRFEFFIDSAILSIANGLILAFELERFEYGVVALIFGVVVSVAGFVGAETESKTAVSWLFFISSLFFISEVSYFLAYGMRFDIFDFTLFPRDIFFLPTEALLLFVALVVIVQAIRNSRRPHMPK
jgi:hypothetical protein